MFESEEAETGEENTATQAEVPPASDCGLITDDLPVPGSIAAA